MNATGHQGLPALPYTLSFPTARIKASEVALDRERKNGTYRFSVTAAKHGSLCCGNTYLCRIVVNGAGTGFSIDSGTLGTGTPSFGDMISGASFRLAVSVGLAWIAPGQRPFRPGDLIHIDAGPRGSASLVYPDSGLVVARGEVVDVDGFWGLRIMMVYDKPMAMVGPDGYIRAEVFLGELSLTVADIVSIGEGAIVRLDTALFQPLVLSSGGVPLANGSLHEYRDLQPSFKQTFTQETTTEKGWLFFRVMTGSRRGFAQGNSCMPQARGHLPSLMQLLHYLCSDRLHGYLKTISLDSSAYILKCCASLQGETVKAADLLLRLSSKPGILSRFIVCNPAKSLVHIDRILSSELIDLCDENEIGAASRETLTDLEDPYPADEVAERTVAALDILSQSILLERLKEEDSTLYAGFRKRFFLMEDIVRLDDKSIQKLLREIDYEILARVFSKSSDKLKARIIANMSKRGGMMLQEEIDILGRISDEVYREAAGKLIEMLRRLIGSGEIIL